MTVEEYDQFLRNAVNEYYVHAMNDPNMSKEEALRTSGEAAERYLTAVEEYKAAMENNAENKIGAVNDNLNTGGPVEQASSHLSCPGIFYSYRSGILLVPPCLS